MESDPKNENFDKGSSSEGVKPQKNHSDLNFYDNPVIAKYLARPDSKGLNDALRKYDRPSNQKKTTGLFTPPSSHPNELLDKNGDPIINSPSQQKALAEWNTTMGASKGLGAQGIKSQPDTNLSRPPQGDNINKNVAPVNPAASAGTQGAVGGSTSAIAAKKVTGDPQGGDTSGALEAGGDIAKAAGGAWIVDFLWFSTLEIFPGALYGLPALNVYMLIGIFTKSPEWHQLAIWQIILIIFFDIIVLFLILLIVVIIIYAYCTGLTGAVAKAAATVGLIPDYCSALGVK